MKKEIEIQKNLIEIYEKEFRKAGVKYPDDYQTTFIGKKIIKLKSELAELSGQEDNPIMSAKDILIKKEILYIHNGELKFNEDILFRGYVRILIEAMHDFASQSQQKAQQEDKISDERFKMPTDKQLIEIMILFNKGKLQKNKLADMLSPCLLILDRLYENGDVTIPTKNENKD